MNEPNPPDDLGTGPGSAAGDPRQAVGGPAGPAPIRPPRSVRRTATIDMQFDDPAGRRLGEWLPKLTLLGRARDAVTDDPADPPVVVAAAATEVGIGANRTIESIRATPTRPGIEGLVGARGGGYLRSALDEVLPGERESGSPLYLLLDDISGTSLIAGFAMMRHPELLPPPEQRPPRPDMEGICIGFAPGATSLDETRSAERTHRTREVPSLVHSGDPAGWHEFPQPAAISMRRARRIDVWRDGDTIQIDSSFQDTAFDPDGDRVAVHEYLLRASADAATLTLQSVEPDPRVLPFIECPSAVVNARQLVGVPLTELRAAVLERLARTNGCTHLNDALRALAEVPVLLQHLDRQLAPA